MSFLFKWAFGKVSSVSNSAAEILLKSIITRFLESSVNSETLSLELFEDWTLRLTLKKVFINVGLLNPYLPVVTARSLYISHFKIVSAYTLSEINLEIDKIVSEFVFKDQEIPKDENLESAITELTDQIPIEKKENWFVNNLKKFELRLIRASINLKFETQFTLHIDNLNFLYTKNLISGSVKKLTFISGERKSQTEIFIATNLNFNFSTLCNIEIDKIEVLINLNDLRSIFNLIPRLTTNSSSSASSPSSELKQSFRFINQIFLY